MTVLLLGDITGRSRVALRMLSGVLEDLGHEVLMLPTVLISNTLNLGAHAQLDTTDYLMESLGVWKKLGIHFDMTYVGYITGMEQARRLAAVIDELKGQGIPVIVDPILGDNGTRYQSIDDSQEEGMRLLCAHADLITPNLTEACLMSGEDYLQAAEGQRLAKLVDTLAGRNAGCSVLITIARTSLGQNVIAGWDAQNREAVAVPFERVPGHHWGTGDLFTGLLMNGLLSGLKLADAAADAAENVAAQLKGAEKSYLPQQ